MGVLAEAVLQRVTKLLGWQREHEAIVAIGAG